jgi:asparagine synthase (glutamine-hydrolysing)
VCGVVAILRDSTVEVPAGVVARMCDDVCHRGPDDAGIVCFAPTHDGGWQPQSEEAPGWTVALGSRRLSILDLSTAGHMPMAYAGHLWTVYNGELYNYVELRSELERLGHGFRSASDTEVLLAAYAQWGPECFARFRGMWGVVLFDSRRGEVVLCRDRLGIKPLYLWRRHGLVAVVSEVKQLLRLPAFVPRLERSTAAEYLRTGYEDPSRSFFRDVRPIPPGTWLRIPVTTLAPGTSHSYWQPERVRPRIDDPDEAGRLFADKLAESVRLHLRSDVPVGCALSGGLDSSAIAVLAHRQRTAGSSPLHTFTCTFPGYAHDERGFAETVVGGIRATPHYVTPTPDMFLADLSAFVRVHDEPVGHLSVYASYCLARLMRAEGVPVTLNGQGGDEILSGYWQSYFLRLRALARQWQVVPLLRHVVGALGEGGNAHLLALAPRMLRRYRARTHTDALMRLRSSLPPAAGSPLRHVLALDERARRIEEIRRLFLPRLLKWDDRNSMAFSVEGRYPFLDHELIELCLAFTPETLHHAGWTKWPLRLGLRDVLPSVIRLRRSKWGFEAPQDAWLAGPLRPVLQRWLREERPLWDYVYPAEARRLAEHTWSRNGRQPEPGQALFRLFIFDHWLELFGVGA